MTSSVEALNHLGTGSPTRRLLVTRNSAAIPSTVAPKLCKATRLGGGLSRATEIGPQSTGTALPSVPHYPPVRILWARRHPDASRLARGNGFVPLDVCIEKQGRVYKTNGGGNGTSTEETDRWRAIKAATTHLEPIGLCATHRTQSTKPTNTTTPTTRTNNKYKATTHSR